MSSEPITLALLVGLGLVPYALAIYALVLLVRMSRTQSAILAKLESFEQALRQR